MRVLYFSIVFKEGGQWLFWHVGGLRSIKVSRVSYRKCDVSLP